jgi:hypothetical protein
MHAVGSTCTVNAGSSKFHGCKCTLVAYEPDKSKWRVKLQESGKQLLVAAASLECDDTEELEELDEVTPGLGTALPPFEVAVDAGAPWQQAASAALLKLGACVLKPPDGAQALVSPQTLERCRCDARPRLDHLCKLASAYRASGGGDEGAAASDLGLVASDQLRQARAQGALQFREIYARNAKEHRFDVTVVRGDAWVGAVGGSADAQAEAAWRGLLAQVDVRRLSSADVASSLLTWPLSRQPFSPRAPPKQPSVHLA